MSALDEQGSQAVEAVERRRLLGEVRARLLAIADSLSDFRVDSAELRNDAQELDAVVRRVQSLADSDGLARRRPL